MQVDASPSPTAVSLGGQWHDARNVECPAGMLIYRALEANLALAGFADDDAIRDVSTHESTKCDVLVLTGCHMADLEPC